MTAKSTPVRARRITALPTRHSYSATPKTNEIFFWAAVGYLMLTGTATLIFRGLERRYAIHR